MIIRAGITSFLGAARSRDEAGLAGKRVLYLLVLNSWYLRFSFDGFGTAMYGKLGQKIVVQVPQSNVMMLLTSSHKATNFDAAKTDWIFFPWWMEWAGGMKVLDCANDICKLFMNNPIVLVANGTAKSTSFQLLTRVIYFNKKCGRWKMKVAEQNICFIEGPKSLGHGTRQASSDE